MPFDVGFCLGEVNGDVRIIQQNREGKFEIIEQNRTKVGRKTSTKYPNTWGREDITHQYKFREGSVLERSAVKNAMSKSDNYPHRAMKKDITMELVPTTPFIRIGDSWTVEVRIKNTTSDSVNVKLVVGGELVGYTGADKAKLESHEKSIFLKGFETHKTPINVPASYYSKYVSDNVSIKMRAVAMVPSTEQSVIKSVYCTLGKPNLEFEDMPDNFTWQTATEFKVAFTNPLDTELTNCEMHVDGSIMTGQMYFDKIANVPAKGRFTHKIKLTPNSSSNFVANGKKSIMVSFSSDQISGIHGSAKVRILPKAIPL